METSAASPKTATGGTDASSVASAWLGDFEAALAANDVEKAMTLFTPDASWRDLVAFSWHIRSYCDLDEIEEALKAHAEQTGATEFKLDPRVTPEETERVGQPVIEAFYEFSTKVGRGDGVVRLVRGDDGQYRALTLLTALKEIAGHEPRVGQNRPKYSDYDDGYGGETYAGMQAKATSYEDHDPAVLIVGAGQAGLSTAARLKVMGIDALVVDHEERVGDNWRNRYESLKLHTETPVNHLPYVPFPDTSVGFTPKDVFGNWLESYVDTLELTVWTKTEFVGGEYDEETNKWSAELRMEDGTSRTLHPRHVVLAVGLSDIPNMPDVKGLDQFQGEVMHSSGFKTGAAYKGKSAIVFGAGNSGLDIGHDLAKHGADVMMIQRGPMTIVNLDPTALLQFALFSSGLPLEICDLMANGEPYPALIKSHKALTTMIQGMDKDMIDGLNKAGFKTHYGPDETGNVIQYFRTGGGYYLNTGAAELIADGRIPIRQYSEVSGFTANALEFEDGSSRPADLVVFATGYKGPAVTLERFFGKDVADRVGEVWGFDAGGELNNMYKRTNQPGLWFTGGGVLHARSYSLYTALQIQACELGLISPEIPEVAPPPAEPAVA